MWNENNILYNMYISFIDRNIFRYKIHIYMYNKLNYKKKNYIESQL